MRRPLISMALFALLLALLHVFAPVFASSDEFSIDYTDLHKANTQLELNMAAGAEAVRAEKMMADLLSRIRQEYSDDPLFLGKLYQAQDAWLAFREAHLESIYPEEDKRYYYGSAFPMCYALERADLAWERVKQLSQWVQGVPYGTVGAGSRKMQLDDSETTSN